MTKRKKNVRPRPPKALRRRLVGLKVYGANRNAPPSVYGIYEEDSYETIGARNLIFRTKLVRGHSIQVAAHSGMLNGTKKEKEYHKQAYQPELYTTIQAAAILCQQLEQACLRLDTERGKGELG